MTLDMIKSVLSRGAQGMSLDAWAADEQLRAEKVALFRDYADGDHRNNMTPEVRRALNIKKAGSLNEFNANHCQVIPDTMNDRLRLTGIEAASPASQPARAQGEKDPLQAWIENILNDNRVDDLQTDIHDAALIEAETYVLVDMEEKPDGTRRVRLTHERAFDGSYGIIPKYETTSSKSLLYAVRIWHITSETVADTIRVNVYYADRIERFISRSATPGAIGTLEEYEDDGQPFRLAWTMNGQPNGEPIGVPVIPFRNRGSQRGVSEIENVIPLQDALNRTLYSMVYSAEMSAFDIKGLVGAQMPAALTPGMALSFYPKNPDTGEAVTPTAVTQAWMDGIRFLQYQQATLEPYLAQAAWLIDQMYEVTNTPRESSGDNASGESLKQRDIKLIGKCERFQIKAGNSWEDVAEMAWNVQQAFSMEKPPPYEAFTAKWQPAEIRDDKQTIDTVMRLWNNGNGLLDDETAVSEIAPFFDWNEQKQKEIVARIQSQRQMQQAQRAQEQAAQTAPQTPPPARNGASATTTANGANGTPPAALKTLDEVLRALEPAAVT
jgi:hypothetical protein